MPRKRIRPEPVFTDEKIERALSTLRAKKLGVSEEELSQIIEEWSGPADPWEPQHPGLPSENFLERLNAYLDRPVRGRPCGQAPDTTEKTLREWDLSLKGYTCKQIAQKLYPTHADDMEPQIRKRLSRLKKILGPAFLTTIRPVTEIPK